MGVQGGAIIPIRMRRFKHPDGDDRIAGRHGGVAEWFRQGPAKPRTAVRFRPPPPIRASGPGPPGSAGKSAVVPHQTGVLRPLEQAVGGDLLVDVAYQPPVDAEADELL